MRHMEKRQRVIDAARRLLTPLVAARVAKGARVQELCGVVRLRGRDEIEARIVPRAELRAIAAQEANTRLATALNSDDAATHLRVVMAIGTQEETMLIRCDVQSSEVRNG